MSHFLPSVATAEIDANPKDTLLTEQLRQVTRSAAHAADCPIAVLYLRRENSFEPTACFGIDGPADAAGINRILTEVGHLSPDSLLIINDSNDERKLFPKDDRLFGIDHPAVRFAAALPIRNADGATFGVLVVADATPHAGLSEAKIHVLRTHVSHIPTILKRESRSRANFVMLGTGFSKTERLRLLESVVVNVKDSVLITEAEPITLPGPRIVYCNSAFTKTTGYSEKEVLGLTPRILQSERTDKKALAKLRAALQSWEPVEVELLNRRKDGTEFWVELSIAPVADELGWFTHWVSVQRDVSDRKNAEEAAVRLRSAEAANQALGIEIQERKRIEDRLRYTAFHDDLTKLRNRPFFMDRVSVLLGRLESERDIRGAVLFIDLDRFKIVNDSLGHRAGDLLLMEVARRISSCTRRQDTLARIGGDEFAVLLEDSEGVASAAVTAQRIIKAIRQPMWIGKQEVFSSCSIGVVQVTNCYRTPEELLRDADIAMYDAKRHNKGGYAIFTGPTQDSAVDVRKLQRDLHNALARNELFLVYQPIFNSTTAEIVGIEALIRWQHPLLGIVGSTEVITAADQSGLSRQIGQWVLQQACNQLRLWCDRFAGLKLRLGVNVSGNELLDPGFIPDLAKALAISGIDAGDLELGVTEGSILRHPEHIGQVLCDVKDLGTRIALDDFGAGHCSLSYLERYEIDTIKVDQSFIASMLVKPKTSAIVQAIIKLGHALELDIVAEGVGGKEQLDALVNLGCNKIQGSYLSQPVSVADIDIALTKQSELCESQESAFEFIEISKARCLLSSPKRIDQVA